MFFISSMKILTKHTDYALAALCELVAQKGKRLTVAQMSRKLDIPYAFLRRLFLQLTQAGVVQSHQGKQGGYSLAREPASVHVGEIIELFQGPLSFTDCFVRESKCPRQGRCKVRKKLQRLEEQFVKDLCQTSLAKLI